MPRRCSGSTIILEERIARLAEREALDAIRPDLDGNEIMADPGLQAGPFVGRAYKHTLDVRLDQGPLPHGEAVAELTRWWAGQQISE